MKARNGICFFLQKTIKSIIPPQSLSKSPILLEPGIVDDEEQTNLSR